MGLPAGPLAAFRVVHEAFAAAEVAHAAIGGWAAIAWGAVRTTKDIDLLIDAPKACRARLEAELRRGGFPFEWRTGGEDDPISLLLRLKVATDLGPIPCDCIVAVSVPDRAALARCAAVDLDGWSAPVLRPEDLIAMKLGAGGPVDLVDAKAVFVACGPDLDRGLLESACRARGVEGGLSSLAD